MILKIASGFIAMGETIEKKQGNLNAACTAWNLSLLPENKRKEGIQKYLEEIRRANPGIDKDDCDAIRHNLELLIKEKIKLFPDVNRQMLGAEIRIINGKDEIMVLSVDMNQFKKY